MKRGNAYNVTVQQKEGIPPDGCILKHPINDQAEACHEKVMVDSQDGLIGGIGRNRKAMSGCRRRKFMGQSRHP